MGGSESQRHQRLYADLRNKLLDLSRRNPMLNYKHRAASRRQLRVVDTNLEGVLAALTAKQRELPFSPLPEPDDIPEDELTDSFLAALGHAKSTDLDYLTRLAALDAVARQDDASLARLERWLRDRVREELELPPRPNRHEFNLVEHARKKDINPSYELPATAAADATAVRHLQSMFFADELDSRLARIAADARLSEQETGLSTLFVAFGFLRWYESNDSDVASFAPLLLLPVQIAKKLQSRKAIYSIKAAAETPEINLSLRKAGDAFLHRLARKQTWVECYSNTSSARCRADSGIVRPSALAVLRLIANSNTVGCSIGSSPGIAPRRIRATYSAGRRQSAAKFGP
jgi:hypothetical protein